MAIVRLDLAYDGTDFKGWAKQSRGIRTVEGEILRVIAEVNGGAAPRLSAAGRTDAGVHARQQVVSFEAGVDPRAFLNAINGALAPEVVAWSARVAPENFDARRSATSRTYTYVIDQSDIADPFEGRYCWHRRGDLSLTAMRQGAAALVGRHDFASFCKAPPAPKTTIRTIQRFAISRDADHLIFTVKASGFLRQQVRSMVGTLVDVGRGCREPTAIRTILRASDRSGAEKPAPASGLTLHSVEYGRPRL